jgi:hypothetical protein
MLMNVIYNYNGSGVKIFLHTICSFKIRKKIRLNTIYCGSSFFAPEPKIDHSFSCGLYLLILHLLFFFLDIWEEFRRHHLFLNPQFGAA